MMWLGVYQSARCWEFSALATMPCQSFTWPQRQMGTRPIANSAAAAAHMSAPAAMPPRSQPIERTPAILQAASTPDHRAYGLATIVESLVTAPGAADRYFCGLRTI